MAGNREGEPNAPPGLKPIRIPGVGAPQAIAVDPDDGSPPATITMESEPSQTPVIERSPVLAARKGSMGSVDIDDIRSIGSLLGGGPDGTLWKAEWFVEASDDVSVYSSKEDVGSVLSKEDISSRGSKATPPPDTDTLPPDIADLTARFDPESSDAYVLSHFVHQGRELSSPRPHSVQDKQSPRKRWVRPSSADQDTDRKESRETTPSLSPRNVATATFDLNLTPSPQPRNGAGSPVEMLSAPSPTSGRHTPPSNSAGHQVGPGSQQLVAPAPGQSQLAGRTPKEVGPILSPFLNYLPGLEYELEAQLARECGSSERIIRHEELWKDKHTVSRIHDHLRTDGRKPMPTFSKRFNRPPVGKLPNHPRTRLANEQPTKTYQLAGAYMRPRSVGGHRFNESLTSYKNEPYKQLKQVYGRPHTSRSSHRPANRTNPPRSAGSRTARASQIRQGGARGKTSHSLLRPTTPQHQRQVPRYNIRETGRFNPRTEALSRASGMLGRDFWNFDYGTSAKRVFQTPTARLDVHLDKDMAHEYEADFAAGVRTLKRFHDY